MSTKLTLRPTKPATTTLVILVVCSLLFSGTAFASSQLSRSTAKQMLADQAEAKEKTECYVTDSELQEVPELRSPEFRLYTEKAACDVEVVITGVTKDSESIALVEYNLVTTPSSALREFLERMERVAAPLSPEFQKFKERISDWANELFKKGSVEENHKAHLRLYDDGWRLLKR